MDTTVLLRCCFCCNSYAVTTACEDALPGVEEALD